MRSNHISVLEKCCFKMHVGGRPLSETLKSHDPYAVDKSYCWLWKKCKPSFNIFLCEFVKMFQNFKYFKKLNRKSETLCLSISKYMYNFNVFLFDVFLYVF